MWCMTIAEPAPSLWFLAVVVAVGALFVLWRNARERAEFESARSRPTAVPDLPAEPAPVPPFGVRCGSCGHITEVGPAVLTGDVDCSKCGATSPGRIDLPSNVLPFRARATWPGNTRARPDMNGTWNPPRTP